MALKKRNKVEAGFSMSSMTDILFLLLLFFVIASTLSSPNDIKLNLPESRAKTSTKQVVAKVAIDAQGNYSIAEGNQKPVPINPEQLEPYLLNLASQDSLRYLALYADQNIPYREIVRVLDIANEHDIKIVIATKPFEH